MKSKILSLQLALFFKDMIMRPDMDFSNINSEMKNIFDAIPQIIPVPQELPAEVPIIVQSSSNKEYNCNIARTRIDFILNRTNDDKTNEELLSNFDKHSQRLSNYVFSITSIIRFGIVARYFFYDENAVKTMQNKFFTPKVHDSEELSLRFNKPTYTSGLKINDILEINSMKLLLNNKPEKGILIQRDINNNVVPGKNIKLDVFNIVFKNFFQLISQGNIEELLK